MCFKNILLLVLCCVVLELFNTVVAEEYCGTDHTAPCDDYNLPRPLEQCCVKENSKYQMVFQGTWSKQSHPKDFPANDYLLHFSDLIGVSHKHDFRLWQEGSTASEGLRQVAEWGSVRKMELELKEESDNVRSIFKAKGLWHPRLNDSTTAVFCVDKDSHLVSLATMIGPSPDWIVGVSGLELCTPNCAWKEKVIVNLYPWDAGTDSGVTYMSPNEPTIPKERIYRITSSFPNDPQAPFFDSTGAPTPPLARLVVTKLSDAGCATEERRTGLEVIENKEDIDRPECTVSDWSPWSQCSVSCGKGLRMRQRTYNNQMKAEMVGCDRQLVSKEMCAAPIATCEDKREFVEMSICATTEWTEWSPCSSICGKGKWTRTRRYHNRMGRKKCSAVLQETGDCMGPKEQCDEDDQKLQMTKLENIDPMCAVTSWSEWSPCSTTCGQGYRARTRVFLVPKEQQMKCNVATSQKVACIGEKATCDWTMAESKDICMENADTGPCRGYFPRWHYDSQKKICHVFTYGGCRGNRNNFQSFSECKHKCEGLLGSREQSEVKPMRKADRVTPIRNLKNLTFEMKAKGMCMIDPIDATCSGLYSTTVAERWYYDFRKSMCLQFLTCSVDGPNVFETIEQCQESCERLFQTNVDTQVGPKINCMVTEWTEWSPCSATCGKGRIERTRMIKAEPQNGGKSCPKKLLKKKKCRNKPCRPKKRMQKNDGNDEILI